MDKIQKALQELTKKEQGVVKIILINLSTGKLKGLDIQKLRGHKHIYRVRKGAIRIIYSQQKSDIFVLAIERRSEKTYRGF